MTLIIRVLGGYGGYDDGPIGPVGPGRPPIGGVGQRPWQGSRCEDDSFRQVGRQRMQRRFVRRFTTAQSLAQCQRECTEARDFICRSFNYRYFMINYLNKLLPFNVVEIFKSNYLFREVGFGEPRDNCELSDRDTRELDAANPAHFDNTANEYDFYERALGRIADDCLDGMYVSIIFILILLLL